MYAVNKLIADKIKEEGLSKKELALKMGYKNLLKGMHNIHRVINESYYSPELIKNIIAVLPIDQKLLDQANYCTLEKLRTDAELENLRQEINQRKHFIPYVYKKTSRQTPTQICFCALMGGSMKYIVLGKEIIDFSHNDQIKIVSTMIKEDYEKNEGRCIFFGDITGYVFYRNFDTGTEFDVYGNIIEETDKKQEYPNPFNRPFFKVK